MRPGGNLDVLAAQRVLDVVGRRRRTRPCASGSSQMRIAYCAAKTRACATPGIACRRSLTRRCAKSAISSCEWRSRREREPDDRLRVGFLLLHDRLARVVRQQLARLVDAIAHVGGGVVGVAVELEHDRDLRALGAAGRGDEVDALDAGDRVLDRLGDLRLDHRRVGAGIAGRDGDDRRVDVRDLAHRQALVADEPDQHDDQVHHGREDRAADRELRKGHVVDFARVARVALERASPRARRRAGRPALRLRRDRALGARPAGFTGAAAGRS